MIAIELICPMGVNHTVLAPFAERGAQWQNPQYISFW
jgi:hypothetical protein